MEYGFDIQRYPESGNKSLRPWSAADEYLMMHWMEANPKHSLGKVATYHDRFGYLTVGLSAHSPKAFTFLHSQGESIMRNATANHVLGNVSVMSILEESNHPIGYVLMRMPKSLDLFELYLNHIQRNSGEDVIVMVGFMTKHFSSQMLKIAALFFEEVEQSRAWKKSRVLTLRKKKIYTSELRTAFEFGGLEINQYLGVFSAGHIDYATQFLLGHLHLQKGEKKVMDLASGNGIIAKYIRAHYPDVELHLVDDSHLAIASSKLNVRDGNTYFHCSHHLGNFESDTLDCIITNPPFHFEYEIDISVPLRLFKEASQCLSQEGRLIIVANQHLNYRTHLERLFHDVGVIQSNKKFIIYECRNKKGELNPF